MVGMRSRRILPPARGRTEMKRARAEQRKREREYKSGVFERGTVGKRDPSRRAHEKHPVASFQ